MRRINVTVSDNGVRQEVSPQVSCNYMRLIDYSLFTNDLIINQYNNIITVGATTYTIPAGNYSQTPSQFVASVSSITGLTVTYDVNTGLITFTSGSSVTITIPDTAKKIYGWNSITKTGTSIVSNYPISFTNSDYYYIDVVGCGNVEVRIPDNGYIYSYKVANRSQPGDVLVHRLSETLPMLQVKNGKLSSITIVVLDSNFNPVPNNGSEWTFFFDTYNTYE